MTVKNSQVSSSLEDYLEAIYHIVESKGAARAKDIVLALGVHNSSVTQALRLMSEKGLINYAPYEVITLTDSGKLIALEVVQKHEILRIFLNKVLGLATDVADDSACRMEHATDGVILERMVKFVEFYETQLLSKIVWDDKAQCFQNSKAVKNNDRNG